MTSQAPPPNQPPWPAPPGQSPHPAAPQWTPPASPPQWGQPASAASAPQWGPPTAAPQWGPPTPVAPSESPADTAKADRTLLLGGGACVAVSLASVSLRLAHVLPSGLATGIVVAVLAIGLRIFLRYAAKSASSVHRARVTKTVALVGLGISVLTLFTSLPVLLRGGGSDDFVANVFAHLWTVAILLVVVGTARTLNWQAFFGMGMTGFLAVSGLVFVILRPVENALGSGSVLASVVLAPTVEELLKALPALLILGLAARRAQARPSALEMALLGAVLGTGFALYEDTQYHRGGFHFGAIPIIGLVNPSANDDSPLRVTYFGSGHMIYTMLVVFGLAITVLYRRRFWWAKLAAPVCFVVAVVEHATQNYATLVAVGQGNMALFDLLRVLTLWGLLSTALLIGGIVLIGREERRSTSSGVGWKDSVLASFWLRPPVAQYAAGALARLQQTSTPRVEQGAAR